MLGSFWEPLGEHLEYSVYLTESTDVQPQESSIALRAKQGTVNRFEYVLEGRHIGGIPRQGGASDVDTTLAIFTLKNQMVSELIDVTNDRNILLPYGLIQTLTQASTWNSQWSKSWFMYWNLDAVNCAKQEIETFWRWFGNYYSSGCMSPYLMECPNTLPRGACGCQGHWVGYEQPVAGNGSLQAGDFVGLVVAGSG